VKVHVLGGGGHAKVVIAALQAAGRDVAGVFDDAPEVQGGSVLGVPVVGTLMDAHNASGAFVVAVGGNPVRRRIVEAMGERDWVPVVHPRAWVHPSAEIGPGAVVFAGAIVQPDATVGAHAIVNTGATVDHDCTVGAFAHLAPGVHLAGSVRIGEGAFLGVGAGVVPGAEVGAWSVVGAGAVVIRDLPANVTAVGAPARPIKERPAGWHLA